MRLIPTTFPFTTSHPPRSQVASLARITVIFEGTTERSKVESIGPTRCGCSPSSCSSMNNGKEKLSEDRRRLSLSEALRDSTPWPETGKLVSDAEESLTVESLLAVRGELVDTVLLLRERRPEPEERMVPRRGALPGHEQDLVGEVM